MCAFDLRPVSVGQIEALPRRVLVVRESEPGVAIDNTEGVRFVSMPINYLGYRVDFAETRDPLPEIGPDRCAGVVVWSNGYFTQQPGRFLAWVEKQIAQGVPVVFMNGFGAPVAGSLARTLGLKPVKGAFPGRCRSCRRTRWWASRCRSPRTARRPCRCRCRTAPPTRGRCCACDRAR